jgi:hypothetical protein
MVLEPGRGLLDDGVLLDWKCVGGSEEAYSRVLRRGRRWWRKNIERWEILEVSAFAR